MANPPWVALSEIQVEDRKRTMEAFGEDLGLQADACLVGSANVTNLALGWRQPANLELLVARCTGGARHRGIRADASRRLRARDGGTARLPRVGRRDA